MNRILPAAILILVALFLGMWSGVLFAGTATLTWTNPTTRTDGTAFPATSIQRTDVEYSLSSTFASGITTVSATGTATTLTIPVIPAGTWYFRAFTVDSGSLRSAASATVSKVVPVAAPNPPVLQTVTATAYLMEVGVDGVVRLVHQPGLSLPLGEACTPIPGMVTYGIVGDYVRRCINQG